MRILLTKPYNPDPGNNAVPHPLGLMYLASYLRQKRKNKDDIRIYDMRLCPQKEADKRLKDILSEFKPQIIGISALTFEYKNMFEIGKIAKRTLEDSLVIAGGPHPTFYSEETLACPDIDYVIKHEGENSFLQLIESIENGTEPRNIKGVGFKKNGSTFINNEVEYISDIDCIPFPSWDLIEVEKYALFKRATMLQGRPYMTIYTSRGCPFSCIYCAKMLGKTFRGRSVENVIEEIEYIINNLGIREFEILDDCFNYNKDRAYRFFEEIIGRNLNIKLAFTAGLRLDLLDEELIPLMKKAGTILMAVAVETASPRIQKLIKKNLDLDKVQKIISTIAKNNIQMRGYFMLGFPTEKKEEMKSTVDLALKLPITHAGFFNVMPVKGSELGQMYEHLSGDVSEAAKFDFFTSTVNLSDEPAKTLFWIHKMAWIKFYFSRTQISFFLKTYRDRRIFYLFMFFLMWLRVSLKGISFNVIKKSRGQES